MEKKIAVLGAGAIGSSVGADLAKAGYDVVLIDQWPAHVEAMKAGGLRVVMPDEDLHTPVRAYHLCEVCCLKRQFDIVLLAAKSHDSCWMAEFITPYLKPDGVLVSVQNSLNDEWVAPIVGFTRDIGCVIELSAEIFTPGLVQRNTTHKGTWFGLGELHGRITPRLRELETIMSCAGRVTLTTNIWGAKWTKLINSSMMLGPMGMLGLNAWEATEPGVLELCIKLGRETTAVGAALGYATETIFGVSADEFMGSTDEILRKNLQTIVTLVGKKARGVVIQDFLKGRRSEADYLNGLIARKGKQAHVPTPANEAVMEIIRQIELGALRADRSNLALVEKMISWANSNPDLSRRASE